MFLKHLQQAVDGNNGGGATNSDHVIFSRYKDVDESLAAFKDGPFLTIGHAGFDSEVSRFIEVTANLQLNRCKGTDRMGLVLGFIILRLKDIIFYELLSFKIYKCMRMHYKWNNSYKQ